MSSPVASIPALSDMPVSVWGVNKNDEIYFRKGTTVSSHGTSWHAVDGNLKQVHVDGGGVVWGVNSREEIYRRLGVSASQPGGTAWERVNGSLKFVTVAPQVGAPEGTSIVFGVNASEQIFYRLHVTASSAGSDWVLMDGQLAQIHADCSGAIWGVNARQEIYRRIGANAATPSGTAWERVDGNLIHVSVAPQLGATNGASVVWGVNSSHDIYMRSGVTAGSAGSGWQHVEGKLVQLHADALGTLWGVNASHQIFRRVGISASNPAGVSWEPVNDGQLKHVSVAAELVGNGSLAPGTLWAVNHGSEIYAKAGTTVASPGNAWARISGALAHVASDTNGTVVGVNDAGQIFKRTGVSKQQPHGDNWAMLDGILTHVSVAPQLGASTGTSVLWGVNSNHDIYMRSGVTAQSNGTGWQQVEGKLNNVAIDANGHVWGVNSAHQIFCRVGVSSALPSGSSWEPVNGSAVAVAVGPQVGTRGQSVAWVVNAAGDIYVRTGITSGSAGTDWHRVDGSLVSVSACAQGTVYGVNKAAEIYRRTGIDAAHPTGSGWERVDGSAKCVSPNAGF